jgi:flagellar basal-body rod modification protein FlgD
MSLASVAAQQSNAAAAANAAAASGNTAASTTASTTPVAGQTALQSLSGNFQDFLSMLMTQLQNQDPTSPMDSNQFTSELVQFSSVEQQINTNTSLTQLIQLTQAGEVMQGSSMTGKQVTVLSTQIPLQNGTGAVQFTSQTAQPVAIAIDNSAGQQVRSVMLTSTVGSNSWSWDGTNNSGSKIPDGAYNISVIGANPDGSTAALAFTVTGTATGTQSLPSGIQLEMGALTLPFTAVQAVGK